MKNTARRWGRSVKAISLGIRPRNTLIRLNTYLPARSSDVRISAGIVPRSTFAAPTVADHPPRIPACEWAPQAWLRDPRDARDGGRGAPSLVGTPFCGNRGDVPQKAGCGHTSRQMIDFVKRPCDSYTRELPCASQSLDPLTIHHRQSPHPRKRPALLAQKKRGVCVPGWIRL